MSVASGVGGPGGAAAGERAGGRAGERPQEPRVWAGQWPAGGTAGRRGAARVPGVPAPRSQRPGSHFQPRRRRRGSDSLIGRFQTSRTPEAEAPVEVLTAEGQPRGVSEHKPSRTPSFGPGPARGRCLPRPQRSAGNPSQRETHSPGTASTPRSPAGSPATQHGSGSACRHHTAPHGTGPRPRPRHAQDSPGPPCPCRAIGFNTDLGKKKRGPVRI